MKETFFQHCEGCIHCHYDSANNEFFCALDLEPKPHPDEQENAYCPGRKEGDEDEEENGGN